MFDISLIPLLYIRSIDMRHTRTIIGFVIFYMIAKDLNKATVFYEATS